MNTDIRQRMKALKCGILIPTYNNSGTIATVASEALAYCEDVWVVNDGSTDNTNELLGAIEGLHLLGYEQNVGKGNALKTGFKAMVDAGMQYALTIDADGQHKWEDLPLLVAQAEAHPHSLICGTRNVKTQEGMPGKNSFANQFSNFWFKVETGIDFPDTQCGYRIYPIARLAKKHFFGTKYEFELEVLVRSSWAGVELIDQPVHVYYPPAEERVSHFRPFQDFSRISVLNTILVTIAFLWIKPRDFFRKISWANIKKKIDENLIHNPDSSSRIAAAAGLGVMFGILPLWGFQMALVFAIAHFLKLNKVIALIFSNISIPPCLPFILWGSYALGGVLTGSGKSLPDIHDITLDNVWNDTLQYVVGSIALAIAASIIVGLLVFCLISLKRKLGNSSKATE
ncbi:MAG: DUF2062 domain-containing protein [Paludibacteraceae bacterium]|nr:DUF2062 domain-containing protein [Paludibacteraceae bacterium]